MNFKDGKFTGKNNDKNISYNNIKEHLEKGMHTANPVIAYYDSERVDETLRGLNNTTFYHGGVREKKSPGPYLDTTKAHTQIHNNLREKNFYEDIHGNLDDLSKATNKTNTGSSLINKVIKFNENQHIITNKSNKQANLMNFDKVIQGANKIQDIIKNGGHIVSFDLETLSGTSEYGHDVLSYITELSATVHKVDPVNGIMTKVKTVDSVLGFTPKEAREAKNYINRITSKPKTEWSNEEKVFYERMNIYGKSKAVANGFENNIIEAKGAEDIIMSKDNAIKGVEMLEGVGKNQAKWLKDNNIKMELDKYRDKYIKDFNKLLSQGKYNGITYDNFIPTGHNISNFDIAKLKRATGDKLDMNYFDTYQAALYSQNELGRNSIYDKKANRPKGQGPATQYSLAEAHGLKVHGKAAHIARFDQEENARMLVQEMFSPNLYKDVENGVIPISNKSWFNSIIMNNLQEIKDLNDSTATLFKGSNQLYFMDHTIQKSRNNQDGALSFEYNPVTKKYKTYDGFTIDAKKGGNINNEGFPAFGPKAGAVYQHDIYAIDLNDEFKKQFMNIEGVSERQANAFFQQYSSSKELYVVKSQEYMDKEYLAKKLGSKEAAEYYFNNRKTYYTIETNKDRLGANLGVNVGEIKNGKIEVNEEALRGLNFKRTGGQVGDAFVKDTDKIDSNLLLEKILDKSTNRTINDSASRKIRDLDYRKLHQIRTYQKKIIEKGGDKITASTPIISEISQIISQGQAIDLTTNEEIINNLGWMDLKTGEKKIVSESISNAIAMDSYVSQMSPLLDSIDQVLDEVYGPLKMDTLEDMQNIWKDPKKKEILWKKDLAFKQLYNDYVEQVIKEPEVINSWDKETYHTAKELNKIDFNLKDINPEKVKNSLPVRLGNPGANIVSIDLNNPNSLLDTFYYGKFNKIQDIVDKDMNAGFDALREAYHHLRSDNRFVNEDGSRIFDNLDMFKRGSKGEFQKYNVSQLLDLMNEELQSFVNKKRSTDRSWGYLNPRRNQNIIEEGLLGKVIQSRKDTILDEVRALKGNLPKDFKLLTNASDTAIDDLVKNYFLTFSKDELSEGFKGLTEQQRKYMLKQYDIAERVSKNKAKDLIESIKGTNTQLALTKKDGKSVLSLIEGNNVTELNDMFRFTKNKGMISYAIGDNEYALKMGFGRQTKISKDTFGLTNTVEKITSGHLDTKNVEWAVKGGRTVSDGIQENTKKIASYLRDASARIESDNGQLFSQTFGFDINEVMSSLPDLIESSNFNFREFERKYNIDEKAQKEIRKLAEDIKQNPYKYRNKAFKNALPIDVNYFTTYYMTPLIDEISKNTDFFKEDDREILSGLGYKNKNRQMWDGIISGTKDYYMDPLGFMDDDGRPPVTQMGNTRLYDKEKVNKDLGKLKDIDTKGIYKDVKAESVYTSNLAEKFLYNNISSTGKANTTGLTMKYLQVDSYSLRNTFLDDKNKGENSAIGKFTEKAFGKTSEYSNVDIENAKEVLYDKAIRLSTYEQQSNMDARVHDINFHRTNTQTINAKKQMINEHKGNLETLDFIDKHKNKLYFTIDENGNIKYEIGLKVKQGDTLGRYGNDKFSQIVTANKEGMFRGRFFDSSNNVVSEETLNKIIKENVDDLSDNNKILKLLNDKFTFKYQVLGLEEDHGTKVFLGASEKTTIDSMKLAIGDIDQGLSKYLKENGMGDIVGKVVKKDYLDEVVEKTLEKKIKEKYKDPDKVKEELEKVMDAIFSERYALSDAIHEIDVFKDVNFITNLDVLKHKSATTVMHNFLNNLRDEGELTTENLNRVFGEGNFKIRNEGKENAQVLLKSGLEKVSLDFDKEKESTLYNALRKDTRVDINGKMAGEVGFDKSKVVGHKGSGHLISVLDDSAGTHASSSNLIEVNDRLNQITKDIRVAKSNNDIEEQIRLKIEKKNLETTFNKIEGEKGVKFSNAMGKNLDRQRYNIDGISQVYKHYKGLGEEGEKEFLNTFGHALDMTQYKLGNLAFNKDYDGKSLTAPITANLRKQLIKANDDLSLRDVMNNEELMDKYGHLVKSVKETSGRIDDISLSRAELGYSFLRGREAMAINEAVGDSADALVEKAVKAPDYKSFRMLDFSVDKPEWLDLQTGGQGNTVTHALNNPYTNNLVIKTGLGGEHEYLALPRMPEVHAGDSLITKKHIGMVQGFQNKFQTYKNAATEEEAQQAADVLRSHINMMKTQQREDITGKRGLARDMTEFRMEQSYMGKGSGIVMTAFDENNNPLFGSKNVEQLDKLNPKIFSQAKFNGKSLNEHYANGAVIDSVFMSEDVFKSMGYFDKDYLENTFKNLNDEWKGKLKGFDLNTLEGQTNAMKHLLSTEGDAFIGVRYPEIMQGSDKVAMGYLDNNLKSNEIRVLGPTGMSAKLDFDGDQYDIARIKNENNESRLNAVLGGSESAQEMKRATDTSIITRATTDNKYWEEQVQNFMTGKKGRETTANAMNIDKIISHKTVAGISYSGDANLSELEMSKAYNKYADLFDKNLDDDELIAQINKIGGKSQQENINEYIVGKSYNDRRNMITAKVYQNAVGETNVTNQKVKSIVSDLLNPSDKDFEYKSNLMYDFLYQAEEAAISSKSSVEGLTPGRAKEWNTSVSNLIMGRGNRQENLSNMRKWLDQNISDKMVVGLYYTKSDSFSNKLGEEYGIHSLSDLNDFMKDSSNSKKLSGELIDDIVTTIDGISGNEKVTHAFESLRVATSQAGVKSNRLKNMMFIQGTESNLNTSMSELLGMFGENLSSYLDPKVENLDNGKTFRRSIQETISSVAEEGSKVSTEEKIGGIIEGVGDLAKSVKGKKLAMGAVGIAASVLVAGFVGGRPRPAETQAMEEATDYQTPMDGYQLADPGMSASGGQHGYVININARSDKGRENAVQALQQAIASGTSSNINVSMNITDNYGNINDRDIEEAIKGAFR